AIVKVKTVNGEVHLQALVYGKKIIVTEASVRRDLQLNDEEGTNCLPNATIFEELTRMGAKTTAWNEFSSIMASAIICLATNQKFNFSKYIFESMVKNLDNAGKFLMYPMFVQVFLDKQLEGMSSHKRIYVTPSHTKKIFGNMKRVGKGFSERETLLFLTMVVQNQAEMGEDKVVYEERDDSLKRAATTTTSLDAEQDRVLDLENDYKFETRSQEVREERRVKNSQAQNIIQGEEIDDIDKDAEITLVHETQGRYSDEEMFDTGVLDGDEVLAEPEVTIKDVNLSVDEVTLAQALAALKSEKAKIQDKGKAKMIELEPVKKLSKKDELKLDEEVAQRLQAEFDEQERIEREKAEANIALKETWDDIQAKIKADCLLAERFKIREQEEFTIEERVKLFQQFLEKRRKHFAAKRVEEKRNRPPTKAQQRSVMCTYLKNIEGWKPKDLKSKSFANIQELFDKEMSRLEQESIKKQKVDEDKDPAELKSLMEVVPDKEEVAIDAIPLATKPPSIVDLKIHKEGKKSYYQIIKSDESSKMYLVFSHMPKSFDREDLETWYKLVKANYGLTRPVEDLDLVLYGNLKTMFDPHVDDQVWKNQSDYRVLEWKLYDSCGVHSLRKQNVHIHMLVEKRYPLTPATITDMLNKKLKADHWNEMFYQRLKFITK
ncbi:hypothetical protein Tco_1033798, partial [Tanacetum coccineum]